MPVSFAFGKVHHHILYVITGFSFESPLPRLYLYRVEFKVGVGYCAAGVDDESNSTSWIGSTFYTTLPNAIKVYLKDISLHEYVNGDGAIVDCHCALLCMESICGSSFIIIYISLPIAVG